MTAGPQLEIDLGDAPCVARINNSTTFIAGGTDAFIFDWDSEVFVPVDEPRYPIDGSGCGLALNSDGIGQIVVVGKVLSASFFQVLSELNRLLLKSVYYSTSSFLQKCIF